MFSGIACGDTYMVEINVYYGNTYMVEYYTSKYYCSFTCKSMLVYYGDTYIVEYYTSNYFSCKSMVALAMYVLYLPLTYCCLSCEHMDKALRTRLVCAPASKRTMDSIFVRLFIVEYYNSNYYCFFSCKSMVALATYVLYLPLTYY